MSSGLVYKINKNATDLFFDLKEGKFYISDCVFKTCPSKHKPNKGFQNKKPLWNQDCRIFGEHLSLIAWALRPSEQSEFVVKQSQSERDGEKDLDKKMEKRKIVTPPVYLDGRNESLMNTFQLHVLVFTAKPMSCFYI